MKRLTKGLAAALVMAAIIIVWTAVPVSASCDMFGQWDSFHNTTSPYEAGDWYQQWQANCPGYAYYLGADLMEWANTRYLEGFPVEPIDMWNYVDQWLALRANWW